MSQKRKSMLMHKLVVLSNLLQENLDELNPTSKRMADFKNNLLGFTEELNNEIKDTETVQRSTYFQEISNKVDTVIRKNFDETK